jgi:hypothetical protein
MSGTLLVLLGIWGGLIPFVGPRFNYAYTPDTTWTMTAGRMWLEVLPAAATVLGGLILLAATSRVVALWAGWLAALAGAWFVVGPTLSTLWAGTTGQAGVPAPGNILGNAMVAIGFFYGLGAVILFLAALALGRLSVVGVRDARIAEANALNAAPETVPEPDLNTTPTTDLNSRDALNAGPLGTGPLGHGSLDTATTGEQRTVDLRPTDTDRAGVPEVPDQRVEPSSDTALYHRAAAAHRDDT